MKRCLQCNRVETDDALVFCRADGTALIIDSGSISGDAGTAKSDSAAVSSEIETNILPHVTDASISRPTAQTSVLPASQTPGTTRELSKPKRLRVLIALTALAFLVIAAAGYFYLVRKSTTAIESIAVLPFQNKSADADTEYLSDGLAESLIYRLSQLPNLKVSPTSLVIRYKGKDTDLPKIARELGVDAIMSGRLVQRGDNLTISVELVDVRNNKLLWGEQYERKMSELLATQREIASEITQNLRLKLSGEGEKALTKRYTDNNEAYQLYLQGRFHYAKRTKDDMLRAIEYFQQAIKLDPNFALAYVGVSESYGLMPSYAYLSPKEAYPQAKAAAQRALTIDPSLAEAHAALATTFTLYDWNWVSAESEYKQAIELNPNVAETHYRYGLSYLIPMGRTDEGIREIKRALELEPLSIAMSANLAGAFMYARQNDLALKQAQETYNLEPSHITARVWLGYIYDSQGMYTEAIALSEKSLQTNANDMDSLFIAGYAYAKMGRRPEAEKILNTFKEAEKARYVEPYDSAAIYAALGDKDKAFAELERDFTERDFYITFLKVDPFMDPLRDDPRFKDLVRRIGLPQ